MEMKTGKPSLQAVSLKKPDFGKIFKGHFALQDHGNKAYFKNIVLKVL